MGWDDAAPTATELAPVSSGWDSEPPTKEEIGSSWSDVPGNAVKDVEGMIKGMASQGKRALDPTGLGDAVMSGSTEPIYRAAKEPIEQVKGFAKNLGQTILHPIDTFKAHPVSTAMNMAPFAMPFLRGHGAPEAIGEAEPIAETPVTQEAGVEPAPTTAPPPSPDIPKVSSELPSSIKEFLEKQAQHLPTEKIPADIRQFSKSKLEQVGETPLNSGTVGKYAQEHARNMTMKSLGASSGQIRKIGLQEAEKLADYAQDKGIVNMKTGDIGAREKIVQMNKDAGQVVGDMRQLATQRGAIHNMGDLLSDIHGQLKSKYETGLHSGENGAYMKALEEVAKTPPTPDKIAKTITNLFQESKNMDRLRQPSGAFADVARKLRGANEDLLSKTLNPKELNAYHHALEDFGATTQLHEFTKLKQARDMGGRLPPGMGATRAILQKALDAVGYRGEAQIVNHLSKWLRENPNASVKAKDIFRKYIDEAAEAADEMGEGLR